MIVGFAGPSCSGKSTLAQAFAARFGAECFSLDEFYIPGTPAIFVDGHKTFERPHQYDGAKLAAAAQASAKKSGVAVIEGFLIYLYPEIKALCDLQFFVDIDEAEVKRRRLARPRNGKVDANFDAIGWKEWLAFGAAQRFLPTTQVLDGMNSPERLLDMASELYLVRCGAEKWASDPSAPDSLSPLRSS